jgi:hypothetical protein
MAWMPAPFLHWIALLELRRLNYGHGPPGTAIVGNLRRGMSHIQFH